MRDSCAQAFTTSTGENTRQIAAPTQKANQAEHEYRASVKCWGRAGAPRTSGGSVGVLECVGCEERARDRMRERTDAAALGPV